MKFEYPVKLSDDFVLREMGQCNQFGFYPFGRLNAWHGGLHMEGANRALRAIADGQIIAYRLPEQYTDETISEHTHQYSNGFVLIKHYYKSPKNQELTFYSLYMHLMSKQELVDQDLKVPPLFAKDVYKVSAKNKMRGLNARASEDKEAIKVVIPQGATVELDTYLTKEEKLETHWSKTAKGDYKKVLYTSQDGETYYDIYISTNRKYVKTRPGDSFTIICKSDVDSDGPAGALERKEANTDSEILRIIPRATALEIEPDKDNTWGKVKYKTNPPEGPTGYVKLNELEETAVFDEEHIVLDEIESCAIPVKAGELIGYSGMCGFERQAGYRAAHVEVFTADEVAPFLSDAKGDGEKEKNYFKLLAGAVLKKALPYKLAKDTAVKIIAQKGDYTQIEVGSLIREGNRSHLGGYANKSYPIKEEHFETVNCLFDGLLDKEDRLFLVEQSEEDRRILRYDYPIKGEKFWVPTSLIKREEVVEQEEPLSPPLPTISPIPPVELLSYYATAHDTTAVAGNTQTGTITPDTASPDQAVEEDIEALQESAETAETPAPAKKTALSKLAKLTDDVEELYLEAPLEGEEDDKIASEIILKAGDFKKIKDQKGNTWQLISCTDRENGVQQSKRGWIKETDGKLKKISAYHWEEFGFRLIKDQQDEFIYDADAPPGFLKEAWQHVDTDGNKQLSARELRYAYNNPDFCERFSLLVCRHSSEWSLGGEKWPSYKSKIEALLDEGIRLEEDSKRKEELKALKKARLEAIEARVKNLYWWKSIKPVTKDEGLIPDSINEMLPDWVNSAGKSVLNWWNEEEKPEAKSAAPQPTATEVCEEEKPKGPTPFPVANSMVYHFHPIAFVRQMRRHARLNELHIYHSGHISKMDFSNAETVIYIYHDKNGNVHELGEFPIIWSQKWVKGSYTKGKVGKWKAITTGNKTRYYLYDGENKTPLITPFPTGNGNKVFSYKNSAIQITLHENTVREFYNPESFATVLGALAEGDFSDIVSNGSVGTDGTGAYSISHINGINMDFKYLRRDKKKGYIDPGVFPINVNDASLDINRQNEFLDALYKFGWGRTRKNLSHKTKENKDLKHCSSEEYHKDHLHIQGFNPNYKNE